MAIETFIETAQSRPSRNPSSTLSSKCQITIPLEVRNRLGLKAGDRVEFDFEDGRTFVRPAHREEDSFDQYIGALGGFSTRQQVAGWTSDMRDDEERKADLAQWDEIQKQRARKSR